MCGGVGYGKRERECGEGNEGAAHIDHAVLNKKKKKIISAWQSNRKRRAERQRRDFWRGNRRARDEDSADRPERRREERTSPLNGRRLKKRLRDSNFEGRCVHACFLL